MHCFIKGIKFCISGHTITDKNILQAWKSHFCTVSKTKITDACSTKALQEILIQMTHVSLNINEDYVFDVEFEFDEVEKSSERFSKRKASGPDSISVEHLK